MISEVTFDSGEYTELIVSTIELLPIERDILNSFTALKDVTNTRNARFLYGILHNLRRVVSLAIVKHRAIKPALRIEERVANEK